MGSPCALGAPNRIRMAINLVLRLEWETMHKHERAQWLLIVVLAGVASGCGASAKQDFDLNQGEATGRQAEQASAIFDDPWVNELAQELDWTYTINEGDQLEVVLFTHPEQTRFVTVRPDGKVSLPYLGDMKAAGREPTALAEEIQERYAEVLVNPRVDVLVQEFGGRFYVLGQVRNPGEFDYERPITLMQAIAAASGYGDHARLTNIVLLRRDGEGRGFAALLDFRSMMGGESKLGDIRLKPFDIVWVPKDNVSRWNDATQQALASVLQGEDIILKGWTLINFADVYQRGNRNP